MGRNWGAPVSHDCAAPFPFPAQLKILADYVTNVTITGPFWSTAPWWTWAAVATTPVVCPVPTSSMHSGDFALPSRSADGTLRQVEIEDALVPAFIVEEHDDGAYTVFVPSVPTPAAGAIYILPRERVHQVDISFARAAAVITKWGAGTRDLRVAIRMAGSADSGPAGGVSQATPRITGTSDSEAPGR